MKIIYAFFMISGEMFVKTPLTPLYFWKNVPRDDGKLDQGDLIHTIDFRTLYASVLEDWMGADSSEILKGRWKTVPLIKT